MVVVLVPARLLTPVVGASPDRGHSVGSERARGAAGPRMVPASQNIVIYNPVTTCLIGTVQCADKLEKIPKETSTSISIYN